MPRRRKLGGGGGGGGLNLLGGTGHLCLFSVVIVDVPVEVLANFKKMKSLSTDQSLILKAIKNSSMLEVRKGVRGNDHIHKF